jgi:molybdate transport system substrate-binding protein
MLRALAMLGCGCVVGCGGGDAARAELLVAAASDLAAAMPELAEVFERDTGVRVVATLGSTGQLASQVEHGAPVDVFLSADAAAVDRLEARGRTVPGARAVYAYGVLVLLAAGPAAAPASVAELADASRRRIAIANPEHAPYGRAAWQALERAGVLEAVQPRLVLAENVRQVVQFSEADAVDVSIAALSLMDPRRHRWVEVPGSMHDPLAQTAAVVATTRQRAAAERFLAFLTGDEGRAILARYGFRLP